MMMTNGGNEMNEVKGSSTCSQEDNDYPPSLTLHCEYKESDLATMKPSLPLSTPSVSCSSWTATPMKFMTMVALIFSSCGGVEANKDSISMTLQKSPIVAFTPTHYSPYRHVLPISSKTKGQTLNNKFGKWNGEIYFASTQKQRRNSMYLKSSLEKDPEGNDQSNHESTDTTTTTTTTSSSTNTNTKPTLKLILAQTRQQITSFFQSKVPPPPNCQLSMTGDVGAIFLYTFLDHYFNSVFEKMMNNPKLISTSNSAVEAIQTASQLSSEIGFEPSSKLIPSSNVMAPSSSVPVWFDTISAAPFGQIPLSAALPIEHHITYAPIMSTAGVASILLTMSWLICGYFTQAFRMENTLECSPRRAIWITFITYVGTCLLMVGMAYGSDVYMGCVDCGKYNVVGGLTKADEDFIFGSVSVLLMWRYVLATFFGYER